MRPDRLSTLRQRLKRGSFEFGALLEGVSTLEEDDDRPAPPRLRPEPEDPGMSSTRGRTAMASPPPAVDDLEPTLPPVREELVAEEATDHAQSAFALLPQPAAAFGREDTGSTQTERMRLALDSLGCRFLQRAGSLKNALSECDVEEGGFHLAHLNQVLELLRDLDPVGDVSRQLGTVAAPPIGRTWPASSWTVVEFAASPFSALLPPRADTRFVSDLIYAAWGVAFASTP
jgi:hypothetical protein